MEIHRPRWRTPGQRTLRAIGGLQGYNSERARDREREEQRRKGRRDSIFSPKFSVADFGPINQTDQGAGTARRGSPYRNSLAYRVQACVTPRTLSGRWSYFRTEGDVSPPLSLPSARRCVSFAFAGVDDGPRGRCFMRRVLHGERDGSGWLKAERRLVD